MKTTVTAIQCDVCGKYIVGPLFGGEKPKYPITDFRIPNKPGEFLYVCGECILNIADVVRESGQRPACDEHGDITPILPVDVLKETEESEVSKAIEPFPTVASDFRSDEINNPLCFPDDMWASIKKHVRAVIHNENLPEDTIVAYYPENTLLNRYQYGANKQVRQRLLCLYVVNCFSDLAGGARKLYKIGLFGKNAKNYGIIPLYVQTDNGAKSVIKTPDNKYATLDKAELDYAKKPGFFSIDKALKTLERAAILFKYLPLPIAMPRRQAPSKPDQGEPVYSDEDWEKIRKYVSTVEQGLTGDAKKMPMVYAPPDFDNTFKPRGWSRILIAAFSQKLDNWFVAFANRMACIGRSLFDPIPGKKYYFDLEALQALRAEAIKRSFKPYDVFSRSFIGECLNV